MNAEPLVVEISADLKPFAAELRKLGRAILDAADKLDPRATSTATGDVSNQRVVSPKHGYDFPWNQPETAEIASLRSQLQTQKDFTVHVKAGRDKAYAEVQELQAVVLAQKAQLQKANDEARALRRQDADLSRSYWSVVAKAARARRIAQASLDLLHRQMFPTFKQTLENTARVMRDAKWTSATSVTPR